MFELFVLLVLISIAFKKYPTYNLIISISALASYFFFTDYFDWVSLIIALIAMFTGIAEKIQQRIDEEYEKLPRHPAISFNQKEKDKHT